MDQEKFNILIEKNFKILSTNLKNRTTDFSQISFWEDGLTGKDLPMTKLAEKVYDIIGCAALGVLPSVEKFGADGFFKKGKKISEWEVKVSAISKSNLYLGQKGGLYVSNYEGRSDSNRRSSLKSKFAGSFDPDMSLTTLKSKARKTALILFDEDDNSIIDVYAMDESVVLRQLENRSSNSTLTLKFNCFEQHGYPVEDCIPDVVGWDEWEKYAADYCKDKRQFTYQ
jgi:hypothetical protein